jgi:transposase
MNKNKKTSKIEFKDYNQNQLALIPPNWSELIPENHKVRIFNKYIEMMDIDILLKRYKGGGAPSYHPKMMLKILLYAYSEKIYSSRKIEKALRENINFMWLAGSNRPNFRTINRFRRSVLGDLIEEVFVELNTLLIAEGYINMKDYFLDGTKLEANANKYSFIWRKNTERYKALIAKKLKEIYQSIEDENDDEDDYYQENNLEELGKNSDITSDELRKSLDKLEERLKTKPKDKNLKKAIKTIKEDLIPRQEKYETQEKNLNGRNSCSKTDKDATFMRMKEDHFKNSQLKPSYNVQVGTENQFIVGYSIHQHPTDSVLLKSHFNKLEEMYGILPENTSTDCGYGSEENFNYLEMKGITAYVKYAYYHNEKTKKFKSNKYRVENLKYNAEKDYYICPGKKKLFYKETVEYTTQNGYNTYRRIYECESCKWCRHRKKCHQSKNNRRIQVNPELVRYKEKARELLDSELGEQYRKKRPIEVEAVFGLLKQNFKFRRFNLRGLPGVTVEFGLLAMAHNLHKVMASLFKYFAQIAFNFGNIDCIWANIRAYKIIKQKLDI